MLHLIPIIVVVVVVVVVVVMSLSLSLSCRRRRRRRRRRPCPCHHHHHHHNHHIHHLSQARPEPRVVCKAVPYQQLGKGGEGLPDVGRGLVKIKLDCAIDRAASKLKEDGGGGGDGGGGFLAPEGELAAADLLLGVEGHVPGQHHVEKDPWEKGSVGGG